MVALAGFAGKRVTPVRRLSAAVCKSEIGLLRCDLRDVGARDCRLTVGDAAVVDGHGVGNQYSKTPASLSSRVRSWSKSRFMNTPPESATVSRPSRAQISLAMRADACAMVTWKSSASLPAGTPALVPSKSALIERCLEFRTWQSSGRDDSVTEKPAILPVGQVLPLPTARQAAASSSMAGSPS